MIELSIAKNQTIVKQRSNKTMSEKSSIYTAINEVMAKVGYVQKERVPGLNYSFAGESALIQALRPAMVEAGIIVSMDDYELLSTETYTTAKGAVMYNVKVMGKIRFTHAPSETSIVVMALGEGADSSDKATNKAMTGAFKYALRQTFMIETGDDPDKDREERATPTTAQKNAPPRQAVAPATTQTTAASPARPYTPDVLMAYLKELKKHVKPATDEIANAALDELFVLAGQDDAKFQTAYGILYAEDESPLWSSVIYHWTHPKTDTDLVNVKNEVKYLLSA